MKPINRRILVVDDAQEFHDYFRIVLGAPEEEPARPEGAQPVPAPLLKAKAFGIESAWQGEAALDQVRAAKVAGRPFSLAFVDLTMPPGWNGIETCLRLWEEDPNLQIVLCSTYADFSWSDLAREVPPTDGLLLLRKPFDTMEVVQLAHALTRKWTLYRESQLEHERLQLELSLAQKLESVGRLAAGVAHEINTPVQFVSDSVNFLRDAAKDLATVIALYREVCRANFGATSEAATSVAAAEEEVDLDYLLENVPRALDRSIDGLGRIATIVRSMKEFAHPDQTEMNAVDLNRAIETTLTIARSEYKYVADVETDFAELPPVTCTIGEINQVVLNLIVNASHAIGDVVKDGNKGLIKIVTRVEGERVVIAISDTGGGIPEAIRSKIFEPFFTTKEVGRGTGQGLAIARSVVHKKHGGELSFESKIGSGTTFFIRLPIEGTRAYAAACALRAS